MKKGCFISVIVTLTVLLAVIFYLIKFHGDELLSFGKDKLLEYTKSKIVSDLEKLKDQEYGDSLKVELDNFFNTFNKDNLEDRLNALEPLSQNIEIIVKDNKIDSTEFELIKQTLKSNE
ncbi:MAG: hypothetical protein HYS24_13330 [Ignavibacteriales bacterium]|nr:hypothetical protein [Ignavibacteriales bacterium]MBK7979654.1 hypothetical protein [Ignavibacteriota bacterium]